MHQATLAVDRWAAMGEVRAVCTNWLGMGLFDPGEVLGARAADLEAIRAGGYRPAESDVGAHPVG